MWMVALPACVVEGLGPIKSLGRSANLTKGHRWKILGIFLVLNVVGGIMSGLLSGVLTSFHSKPVFAGGQYVFQAVFMAVRIPPAEGAFRLCR
jgi:hypothetical protein